MIEIVHHDERCIKGTPDAVIIAEREAVEYNPVAIANQIPRSKIGIYWTTPTRNSRIS